MERELTLTREMLADLPKNGPTDPIEYYRRPVVGWLFRERINRGLRLLPRRRFARALEVGYGAGAVQLALAPGVDELHGIDLDAAPEVPSAMLSRRGRQARLVRGDVCALPYEDCAFELVVCFSVFEHLHDFETALREVTRVLEPGGLFLLGMPAVNLAMEAGFRAIGYKDINHHHVTTPAGVAARFSEVGLSLIAETQLRLPPVGPVGLPVYYDWLLRRDLAARSRAAT
jgi:SAM-dependent methyltransferase